jgi:hypothetical protein
MRSYRHVGTQNGDRPFGFEDGQMNTVGVGWPRSRSTASKSAAVRPQRRRLRRFTSPSLIRTINGGSMNRHNAGIKRSRARTAWAARRHTSAVSRLQPRSVGGGGRTTDDGAGGDGGDPVEPREFRQDAPFGEAEQGLVRGQDNWPGHIRCGCVIKGAVYHNFSEKQSPFEAAMNQHSEGAQQRVYEAIAQTPGRCVGGAVAAAGNNSGRVRRPCHRAAALSRIGLTG